jgi:hypothetical protein
LAHRFVSLFGNRSNARNTIPRAHLVHQPIEVRGATAWVDQTQLAIKDCCLCWQLGEGFHHAWRTVAEFGSAFRIEANGAAVLDDLKSEEPSHLGR